jgi:2-methylcitrate dehydratase
MSDNTERKLVNLGTKLTYDDLTPAVIHAAKVRMIDSFGCALGAMNAPTVTAARKIVSHVPEGRGARLFGTLDRVSLEHATLVNGAMVRYLDMSDAYLMIATAHPSDNIPGVLAVAEAIGASGKDTLLATIACYEAHCRLCERAPFNEKGWDQPVCAAPAMAMAASKLLGLSAEQMRDAIAIALVPNVALNQTRRGNLSMWKGMAGPDAAREGVYAALLAEAGMTGPEDSFEGLHGLYARTMGESYDMPIPENFDNHIYALQQTNVKVFPIRDAIQVPVMTAFDLREKIKAEDIEKLVIYTYRQGFLKWIGQDAFWDPKTRETADHSMPFCIAVALIDGKLDAASFDNDRYLKDDVRELMGRIEIDFDDAYDAVAPATRHCRIEATTKSGETLSVERVQTPEVILAGPSKETVEAKFRNLSGGAIDAKRQDALLERLWAFDELEKIDELIDLTAI